MTLDSLFEDAVSALDAGDVPALERHLAAHPQVVHDRLDSPGQWLREKAGNALDGYFRQPYLLWFVAENPIRNERLPANIAQVTRTIIEASKRENVNHLQEQLDYTLRLVVTGRVPRECGVQHELIDVLIDAGANPGRGNGALGCRNLAALQRLIERGSPVSLAAALCLGMEDSARRAKEAGADERQTALVACALNGKFEAISTLVALGVDVNAHSSAIHPHATPLHHAVDSGSLDAVKVLVKAGARLDATDRIYGGTPLNWAEHLGRTEIAGYLREVSQ